MVHLSANVSDLNGNILPEVFMIVCDKTDADSFRLCRRPFQKHVIWKPGFKTRLISGNGDSEKKGLGNMQFVELK